MSHQCQIVCQQSLLKNTFGVVTEVYTWNVLFKIIQFQFGFISNYFPYFHTFKYLVIGAKVMSVIELSGIRKTP